MKKITKIHAKLSVHFKSDIKRKKIITKGKTYSLVNQNETSPDEAIKSHIVGDHGQFIQLSEIFKGNNENFQSFNKNKHLSDYFNFIDFVYEDNEPKETPYSEIVSLIRFRDELLDKEKSRHIKAKETIISEYTNTNLKDLILSYINHELNVLNDSKEINSFVEKEKDKIIGFYTPEYRKENSIETLLKNKNFETKLYYIRGLNQGKIVIFDQAFLDYRYITIKTIEIIDKKILSISITHKNGSYKETISSFFIVLYKLNVYYYDVYLPNQNKI